MTGAFDADGIIDAMGPLLGLRISDADRPGVRAHLETAARFNAIVDATILSDATEPAPVFTPGMRAAPEPRKVAE